MKINSPFIYLIFFCEPSSKKLHMSCCAGSHLVIRIKEGMPYLGMTCEHPARDERWEMIKDAS